MNLSFLKKYLVFWLCLLVTALLLLGALGGLIVTQRQYSRQARVLDAVTTRLQQLYRREVFPAAANVRIEGDNLKDVVDQYNELNELLRAGQVDLQPMEAAKFMQLLEHSLRQQYGRLQKAGIKFPEKYTFGFDKYAGGQLPAAGDVPRLVQQLKIIEALCAVLQDSGITELEAIERESFEQASAGSRRAPPGPASSSTAGLADLASSQHFKITLKARESAMLEMLNLLSGHPMFMVVTRVEITNPHQAYRAGGPAAAVDTASAPAAQERQVILGREVLDIKLDLDVYQFGPSLAFKEVG